MQTHSHFLITAFGANKYKSSSPIPLHGRALLVGSVLPDLPFWLLTILGELYFLYVAPLPGGDRDATAMQIMEYLHFDRFFNDPLWIISHNFFHSLIINALLIGMGWMIWRNGKRWGLVLFWLAVSTQLHTLIDIFTHSSDGPLLFFPINWTYRFQSPISYWETDSYGYMFVIFEYLLDAFILGYFGLKWWARKTHPDPPAAPKRELQS
jgi:hypothetical protein